MHSSIGMKKHRVIVITGASAGVGRATAREFACQGAKIGLLARGLDGLNAAKREVEKLGGDAIAIPTDISDPEQVETAAKKVEEAFGPIDVWINNAMVSVFSPVKEMLPEEYKRVTDVTYLGYVYGTLVALKRMLLRNRGIVIQVGSALAYRSIPLQSAYCAAKHAILGFTESLRTELLHDRSQVQVCNVHLPAMNTPQFDWTQSRLPNRSQPVPPIFQPEVAARGIVWLSKHPKRELWIGGSTILAILAEKFATGLADWLLSHTGYSSQQTNEPDPHDHPANLWKPVPGDAGTHGRFDERSKSFSLTLWLNTHREILFGLGIVLGSLYFQRTGPGNA